MGILRIALSSAELRQPDSKASPKFRARQTGDVRQEIARASTKPHAFSIIRDFKHALLPDGLGNGFEREFV